MNEKLLRFIILIITAAIHIVVIFFIVFETVITDQYSEEHARVMKLLDLEEEPPPPEPEPELPQVEAIAEVMIETDIQPLQTVVAAGTIIAPVAETFLPAHMVSVVPQFDEEAIQSEIIYPQIALRSGIEGRVILDLFVDQNGIVQRVTILREEPEGRGFGEAAVRVFSGRRVVPAQVNGERVSCSFRYPVLYRIR